MYTLAKLIMKAFESKPTFDFNNKLSENIRHKTFLEGSENFKREKLLIMAGNHFNDNENNPFDTYFAGYDFENLFKNKRVLDLGCWCGGKTVSYALRWKVKEMYGIDIDDYFILAANLFSKEKGGVHTNYFFKVAFAENLPYPDNFFDGIVSYDVLEHVKSIEKVLVEIKRVLKNNSYFFGVFPSYYTLGEHHMDFVTKFPIIHWLFPASVLEKAYLNILNERGDEAYWYRPDKESEMKFFKLNVGIGLNGITFRKFIKLCKKVGFSKIKIIPTPLFSVGKKSRKYKILKILSNLFKPFVKLPIVREFFSHRIVCVLQK